jgi:hypothetical protein
MGGRFINGSGALRGEVANVCLPSLRAKGRANARLMTGSAKQSILSLRLDGLLRCARNDGSTIVLLFESFRPSCPDLTRASIHLRKTGASPCAASPHGSNLQM